MTSNELGYGVRVSLGVYAFYQSLEELEALLGPSDGGWSQGTTTRVKVHNETYWVIRAPRYVGPMECDDAQEQVLELLNRVEENLINALTTFREWEVRLTIVGLIRSSADWPGMSLSPATMSRLAGVRACIDMDVIISA